MKGVCRTVSLALVAALSIAGAAGASHESSAGGGNPRDFAVGSGTGVAGAFGTDHINFSAHGTGSAKGQMTLQRKNTPQGNVLVKADVHCLEVSGNLARMSGTIKKSNSAFFPEGGPLTFEVQDNDQAPVPAPDAFSFSQTDDCAPVAGSFGVVEHGNFVVHDASG
jgi:hypothetical protein